MMSLCILISVWHFPPALKSISPVFLYLLSKLPFPFIWYILFLSKIRITLILASIKCLMLASPLHPVFHDPYNFRHLVGVRPCTPSWFLFVFGFLCLNSSFIRLTMGLEYLVRETSNVFIPLIIFLSQSFFSGSFFYSPEELPSSSFFHIWWLNGVWYKYSLVFPFWLSVYF